MQDQKDIIDCYNKTADHYAEKFIDELEGKHFDQIILKAFCEKNKSKGKLIDFGCGPGQTTKFVFDQGLTNLIGTDLSPEMIKVAERIFPDIQFEVADLLDLKYSSESFGSAIAFYAIVHFDYIQIKKSFEEVNRVLLDGGEFLFSFHIGNEIVHLTQFLEKEVNIKFQFFEVDKIKLILQETQFEIIDFMIRHPYPQEHQTQRAYVWVRKGKNM